MSHQRERFVEEELSKKLSYSPCVGLMGMRQVGKSTLLKKISGEYHTFDDQGFLIRFEKDPQSFLQSSHSPLAFDEVQKSPMAFDAVKYAVDEKKTPGRFLLSGSVRFSSRKQIRESLTGRIALIELLPFTLAECHHKPLSLFVKNLESTPMPKLMEQMQKRHWAKEADIANYLITGGLPGICFRRDATIRSEMFNDHLETLLSRDIQMIRAVKLPYIKLHRILEEIAVRQGQPINMSELARSIGTSVPTIKSTLEAFEGLFLIKPYGSTYFIQDCGLSHHLAWRQGVLSKADLIRIVYHELSAQINYTAKLSVKIRPLQTRGGMDVPFFLEYQSGVKRAFFVEETDRPTHKALNSFAWLKKKYPKLEAVFFYQSDELLVTHKGMFCVPLKWLF